MDKTKMIIAAILIFAFGLSVGLMTGVSVYRKPVIATKTTQQEAKACFDMARQRLKDTGFIPSSGSNTEVKSITGEITSISGKTMTIKTRPLEALSDPELDNRTITINDGIKINRMDKVEGVATGQDAKSVLSQNTSTAPAGVNLNYHYENKEITFGDLKIGDKIFVSAETNIIDQKNIQAKSVFLLPLEAQKK